MVSAQALSKITQCPAPLSPPMPLPLLAPDWLPPAPPEPLVAELLAADSLPVDPEVVAPLLLVVLPPPPAVRHPQPPLLPGAPPPLPVDPAGPLELPPSPPAPPPPVPVGPPPVPAGPAPPVPGCSFLQSALQPSPLLVLPSSHSSTP